MHEACELLEDSRLSCQIEVSEIFDKLRVTLAPGWV